MILLDLFSLHEIRSLRLKRLLETSKNSLIPLSLRSISHLHWRTLHTALRFPRNAPCPRMSDSLPSRCLKQASSFSRRQQTRRGTQEFNFSKLICIHSRQLAESVDKSCLHRRSGHSKAHLLTFCLCSSLFTIGQSTMLPRIPTRHHPTTLKCLLQLFSNLQRRLKSLTSIRCSLSFTTNKAHTNSKC